MKAIEQEMIAAITAIRAWRLDNTSTHVNQYDNYVIVRLHGNLIAVISPDEVELRDGGWQSATTKSRLNAITSHFGLPSIHQKAKIWYIGDQVWTGHHVFNTQPDIPQVHSILPMKYHFAVGACPYCNRLDTHLNNVPLTAYCDGYDDIYHPTWEKVVPAPFNPYLDNYDPNASPTEIQFADLRTVKLEEL